MIKVMTIFGTRPEAIKMAPLVKELEKREEIKSVVAVTAQHRQMLDQVLKIFDITPDYDLNIMKDRQTLVSIVTGALEGLDEIMKKEEPDIVLVHGDTSTTFVGALAAFYNQISVGHVEAGLRTFDKYSPFPEEMNRKLTGQMTDMHFSPTVKNKNNLLREGFDEKDIYITGNTVIDALKTTVREDYQFADETLKNLDFESKRVILVTAHRRENLGRPLQNICEALRELATTYQDVEIVYPIHMNPAVREVAHSVLDGLDNVKIIEPLDVEELHNAMNRCYMVMTDSGGIQEEAPSLKKPVLVLRTETERPEAVEAGTVKIAGVEKDVILSMAKQLLDDKDAYAKMARAANPYGDGTASERIVDAIIAKFNNLPKPEDFLA